MFYLLQPVSTPQWLQVWTGCTTLELSLMSCLKDKPDSNKFNNSNTISINCTNHGILSILCHFQSHFFCFSCILFTNNYIFEPVLELPSSIFLIQEWDEREKWIQPFSGSFPGLLFFKAGSWKYNWITEDDKTFLCDNYCTAWFMYFQLNAFMPEYE